MKVIDVHCHIVPAEFPPAAPTCAERWPAMDHRANNEAMVMVGKKEFRLVDSRCWDVKRRVADMDAEGTAVQVVSPMPELLSYWIDAKEGAPLSHGINQAIAEMINAAPGRFQGLGMVPMQDPQAAAKELGRFKSEYGFVGFEIGSNITGKSPGDPFFEPVFAEAERLGLCVFVHALHPQTAGRIIGPGMTDTFIGYPSDVGLAAASVITGGVLERHPNLRIGFSHGGGTLSAFLSRLQSGWTKVGALKKAFAEPNVMARKMYYDNIVFEPRMLRYILDTFGTSQVFVGSDYPFTAGQQQSAQLFDSLGLSAADRDAVLGGNAARFLNIPAA